jgi:DNA-binding NarL/FixJ family response regulator
METIKTPTAGKRLRLIASNRMRIAGIQGVYGDPWEIEIVPTTLREALQQDIEEVLLVDAGSSEPLFELLDRLREANSQARVIVIGVDQDETYIECVIAAGAKGFLGANASAEEFRYAVTNVREGSIWATRRVLSRLAESQMSQRPDTPLAAPVSFTGRERQIIEMLLAGKANREIGDGLSIGPDTVKAHLGRIMRKAGVVNRIELTMFAVRQRSMDGEHGRSRGSLSNKSSPEPTQA